MSDKNVELERVPSNIALIELPPMNGREVWMLINFLSQAVRALRQAYPHEIIQFLKYAQRRDLVHNPDDLWPDVDIMDETGEVDDIQF